MVKAILALVVVLVLLPVATAFLSLDAYRVAKIGNYKVKLQLSVEETAMDDATFDATTRQSYVQLNQKGGKSKRSRLKETDNPLALPIAPGSIPGALTGEPSWPALAMALLDYTSAFKLPSQDALRNIVLATLLAKVCFPDLPLCSPLILAITLTTVVKQQKKQINTFTGGGSSSSLQSQL